MSLPVFSYASIGQSIAKRVIYEIRVCCCVECCAIITSETREERLSDAWTVMYSNINILSCLCLCFGSDETALLSSQAIITNYCRSASPKPVIALVTTTPTFTTITSQLHHPSRPSQYYQTFHPSFLRSSSPPQLHAIHILPYITILLLLSSTTTLTQSPFITQPLITTTITPYHHQPFKARHSLPQSPYASPAKPFSHDRVRLFPQWT